MSKTKQIKIRILAAPPGSNFTRGDIALVDHTNVVQAWLDAGFAETYRAPRKSTKADAPGAVDEQDPGA